MKTFDCVLLGSGLSALVAACYLTDNTNKSIAIVANGLGGTPFLAAFNGIIENGKNGDSLDLYNNDMYNAGYQINNMELVSEFSKYSMDVISLLEKYGVEFSKNNDGTYLLRLVSGSSVPRSLCNTSRLIGEEIVAKVIPRLKEKGVVFFERHTCVKVLTDHNEVAGIAMIDVETKEVENIYAPTVLAAWGGIGNLYNNSTYPMDIDGRTLGLAIDCGAHLVDLEFVEFEPMVVIYPEGAKGEPCPTAMLGEGAYLLNSKMERFLLKVRPQGEAGAPKTLINTELWKQIEAGKQTLHGGVYVDLRHIDLETLKAYPWFYNRVLNAGLDVKKELLEVGPAAHSHSGGIEIDVCCESNIKGFFASGEAAGGMHGACRMAGNAATMAALSGYVAAMNMAKRKTEFFGQKDYSCDFKYNAGIKKEYADKIRQIITKNVNRKRDEKGLSEALAEIIKIKSMTSEDTLTAQLALSAHALIVAALARCESRGTHIRSDYPYSDDAFNCEIRIKNIDGELQYEKKHLKEFISRS